MIVDCADTDTEMATDPFLEAGIEIPKELPYQTPMVKKKFSIIKRRDSKMNEPSPANSCVSLARSSSNAMQININQLKKINKKLAPRRRKSTETNTSVLCLEIGDIPKHFYDLSNTAPVVPCEKPNGSSLQFRFQKVQGDLKRSQSDAPSIVVIKPVPNVEQSENKSETNHKVVSKVPHNSPPFLKKRVSSIFEESEEVADGEKNVEADIESDNSSKRPPKSPALLKKKISAIFEESEEKGDGEKNVEVGIESNNLNINRGFENV